MQMLLLFKNNDYLCGLIDTNMDWNILSNAAIVQEIGVRVKAYRLKKRFSQQELAERAGISVFLESLCSSRRSQTGTHFTDSKRIASMDIVFIFKSYFIVANTYTSLSSFSFRVATSSFNLPLNRFSSYACFKLYKSIVIKPSIVSPTTSQPKELKYCPL